MTTLIARTVEGPRKCPACDAGGDQLKVATAPAGRTSDGRDKVEFSGYDCANCGEKLRFSLRA